MTLRPVSTCVCCLFLLLLSGSFSAEFEVRVPTTPQVAIHGQHMVLECSFTVEGALDMGKTVITWQRGHEVVHSFYYGQDQLGRQSPRYANRTSLYPAELEKGNASLRLQGVGPGDAGDYTCSVSSLMGSQRRTFALHFAAFYTEPRLEIKVTCLAVELSLESLGYPCATVQWVDEKGNDVSKQAVTNYQQNADGLFRVSSTLAGNRRANSSVLFILRNAALNQEIIREFSLVPGEGPTGEQRCRWPLVVVGALMVPIVFAGALLVCLDTPKTILKNLRPCRGASGGV
uniref:Zgc:153911 n=1 Tax=Lepisosteus oculatus TaxID=7918 RepID=W5M291_LEPOC|nr:PREDICTED: CD276 antigen-like [Lepisosteus oculatus]XP_015203897.1 PREDICTED: CD276 antigen-like [Lepisosteus oculatus]